MTAGRKELLVVALLSAIVTVVVTWPIAAHFGSAGRLDNGDAKYSIWNVTWVAHALTSNPSELWNANIFFPHKQTLAYSEANLVAGILAIPVWLSTHNPYAAMNSVILASFVMAAVAMFALVRHLTNDRWSAGVAALLYAFCPYTFSHLGHIQLLMTFGLPFALLRMHIFVAAPSVANACWLGGALALQALACGYYGIYSGLAVAAGVVWMSAWTNQWRAPRLWGTALLAVGIAAAVVWPFLMPYFDIQRQGFGRTLEDARIFSADWRSYFASAMLQHQWMLPLLGSWRAVLFPGFLAVGLSAVAILRAMSSRHWPVPTAPRHVVVYYVLTAGLAFWGSFGPDAGLYAAVFDVVPFMSLLRDPARLGLLVTLALAITAGIGLSALQRTLQGRHQRAVVVCVMTYAVARSSVGALELTVAPAVAPAYRTLQGLPRGAVAEFPFFHGGADRHRQTEYMLQSTRHWQPLINGYSDHIPADTFTDMEKLGTFPSADAWAVLKAREARYVVIHWDLYEPADRVRLELEIAKFAQNLHTIRSGRGITLMQILKWPDVNRATN